MRFKTAPPTTTTANYEESRSSTAGHARRTSIVNTAASTGADAHVNGVVAQVALVTS